MRKINLKTNALSFILGGIVFSSIVVYATILIASSQVSYNTANSHSSYSTVQGALDDLYNNLYDIKSSTGSGFAMVSHHVDGLSTELIAGLYRYQGTTADNYICFGTTDKDTCVNDTGKYMYRVIGINSNGQMKLIKIQYVDEVWGGWSSNGHNSPSWPNSPLFTGLNGSGFLENTNYIPDDTWKNRIVDYNWQYGTIDRSAIDGTPSEIAALELGFTDTVNAKISLMYVTDYIYSLPGGNNCIQNGSVCATGWIFRSNSWTMTGGVPYYISGYGNYCRAWNIGGGTITDAKNTENGYACSGPGPSLPVFFLTASQTIASGKGTLDDPYILS